MLALFCLKANSKHNSMIAPMDNEIRVDVIPDAKYLSNTIKTKSEGAKAHIPMMKLDINSIVATDLSRNR
tara:strand:- start:6 stop:215 length:210 start_codon:yes stop_codon:yes gene_type:complete